MYIDYIDYIDSYAGTERAYWLTMPTCLWCVRVQHLWPNIHDATQRGLSLLCQGLTKTVDTFWTVTTFLKIFDLRLRFA